MFGQPWQSHYAAAKTGLVGLTNVIALEGAEHDIKANSVLPLGFSRMVTETLGDAAALEETGFPNMVDPALVVPIVTYLAGRDCEVSHQNYSAGTGHFARVFVGLAEGWGAPAGTVPRAEDICAHPPEMSSTDRFTVPGSIFEEVFAMCERLGVNALG